MDGCAVKSMWARHWWLTQSRPDPHPLGEPDRGEGSGRFLGEGPLRGRSGQLWLRRCLRTAGPAHPPGTGLSRAPAHIRTALSLSLQSCEFLSLAVWGCQLRGYPQVLGSGPPPVSGSTGRKALMHPRQDGSLSAGTYSAVLKPQAKETSCFKWSSYWCKTMVLRVKVCQL